MKIAFWLALIAIIAGIGSELYALNKQRAALSAKVERVGAKVETLTQENKKFAADIEFYSNPQNQANALKEVFNYKDDPKQKLYIIVPKL